MRERGLDVYLCLTMNGTFVNDLGSARHLEYTQLQTTAVGTYAWMATEVGGMTCTAIQS